MDGTVVIVDGQELLASSLALVLRQEGLDVTIAGTTSAEAVVEVVRQAAPVLVLLDPDLGSRLGCGLDLIRRLVEAGGRVDDDGGDGTAPDGGLHRGGSGASCSRRPVSPSSPPPYTGDWPAGSFCGPASAMPCWARSCSSGARPTGTGWRRSPPAHAPGAGRLPGPWSASRPRRSPRGRPCCSLPSGARSNRCSSSWASRRSWALWPWPGRANWPPSGPSQTLSNGHEAAKSPADDHQYWG